MKFCLFLAIAAAAFLCNAGIHGSQEGSDIDRNALKALNTYIHDTQNLLDPFIMNVLNLFISIMDIGIPQLGIPVMDPLKVPNVFLNMTDPKLKMKGDITNVAVSGLASSEVTRVQTNLLALSGEIDWELPELVIEGDYDIDGLAAFIFPIYGKGPFRIAVSDVKLFAGIKLTMVGEHIQVKGSFLNIHVGKFDVKFEGLLGGGDLGDTLNEIINIIGQKIFDLIKPSLQDSLMHSMEQFVYSKLMEVTLEDILAGNTPSGLAVPMADAGPYMDQVLANLRELMILNDLDRIVLPDYIIGFSRVILGVTWHGQASIYGGLVNRLETIHRSGPANLNVENGDIVFDTELEINDGTLFASMAVKFMNLGPKVSIEGSLKRVKVQIKCRIASGLDKVSLDQFNIKDLGLLDIDIKGLGLVLNFLIEIVSESIGNLVKGLVANVLEGAIKNLLSDLVSQTAFPPALLAAQRIPLLLGSNLVATDFSG
jgi:hypothetical protein